MQSSNPCLESQIHVIFCRQDLIAANYKKGEDCGHWTRRDSPNTPERLEIASESRIMFVALYLPNQVAEFSSHHPL